MSGNADLESDKVVPWSELLEQEHAERQVIPHF